MTASWPQDQARRGRPDAASAASGHREERGIQIVVNEVDRRRGAFGQPGKTPLKEDGRISPKTEAAFAETAKRGGMDTLLDRIDRDFGPFG